jgi:hypothetical protein
MSSPRTSRCYGGVAIKLIFGYRIPFCVGFALDALSKINTMDAWLGRCGWSRARCNPSRAAVLAPT